MKFDHEEADAMDTPEIQDPTPESDEAHAVDDVKPGLDDGGDEDDE